MRHHSLYLSQAMTHDNISVIHDHYKDTCSITNDAIKRRDRLMLFVIVTVGFFAFQTIFPSISNQAVNDFLNFKFGLTLKLNLSAIGDIVWYLLLILTLRYLQTAVFVQRQHDYVHTIEDKFNKHFGSELITREGKAYLSGYPAFSNWMSGLYTIVFPLLLLAISGFKIVTEWQTVTANGFSLNLFLDSIAFSLLAISVILYLWMIHFRSKKTDVEKSNESEKSNL